MNTTAELVFVPTPGMGHLPSTIKLAKLILQRNEHISISVYMITHTLALSKACIDAQSRYNNYSTRLTFITFPPPSNPPDSSASYDIYTVVELHKPLVKQAIEDRVKAGSPKPVGFVLNFFCTAMVDVANELDIPSYIFYTPGASLLNFKFYAQSLADDHGLDIVKEFSDPGFSRLVPGFKNPVMSSIIPMGFVHSGEKLVNMVRKFKETKGILINTFVELDTFAIQALLTSDDRKIPPIYPVGPLMELDIKSRGGDIVNVEESVIEWLDAQPKGSVVFLCFGSMGCFHEEQVKEIADGLEKSGYRFLWSLRKPPPKGTYGRRPSNEVFLEGLPEGFLDCTSHRGKIIGLAPQVAILAHPAIGGFVSHCGWNSILESLWFGVPMAAFPIYAEQHMNAFKLVKELELAVEIKIDYNCGTRELVTAEEIEKGVKNLMTMDESMRGRIKKMSDEGKKALEEGGSSYNTLARFIEDVLNNVA